MKELRYHCATQVLNKVAVRTTFIFQKPLVSSVKPRIVEFRPRRYVLVTSGKTPQFSYVKYTPWSVVPWNGGLSELPQNYGTRRRTRTFDFLLVRETLSPLSYAGINITFYRGKSRSLWKSRARFSLEEPIHSLLSTFFIELSTGYSTPRISQPICFPMSYGIGLGTHDRTRTCISRLRRTLPLH